MAKFKDHLKTDLDVFVNSDEFAEKLYLEGEFFQGIVDDDELKRRTQVEYEGIVVGDLLFFCKVTDLPGVYRPEMRVRFQREGGKVRIGTIFDVKIDAGMYEMILNFNEG